MRKLLVCGSLTLAVVLLCAMLSERVFAEEAAPAAAAGAHDAGHKEAAHEEGGVPLDFKTNLALWSFVVFIVFAIVLKMFAWGPLSAALDQREDGIRQNIADAEQARLKAEQMLAEHARKLEKVQDEVRKILAEARRDADHTKQDIINVAQQEADRTRQRAVEEIQRAADAALNELFDTMASQVVQATEHVLSRSLRDGDQDRLIDDALAQFREAMPRERTTKRRF